MAIGERAPIAWALVFGGGAPMAGEETFQVVPDDWLGGAPMTGEELFEVVPDGWLGGALMAGDGGVKEELEGEVDFGMLSVDAVLFAFLFANARSFFRFLRPADK